MDEQKTEHQIELATRAAALVKDETTGHRFRSFAEELKRKLLRMMRRGHTKDSCGTLQEVAMPGLVPGSTFFMLWCKKEKSRRVLHPGGFESP